MNLGRTHKALLLVVSLLALAHVALVGCVIALRIAYPFELEWMEGSTLEHALRIADGQAVYTEPTLHWTAAIYTPVYYYAVAGMHAVTGGGFFAGRLVSVLSWAATLAVLAIAMRRRMIALGLLAAGLYASTFEHTLAWVDLVRVDSLFVMALLAGLVLLRNGRGMVASIGAGLLLALAVMTKQTALVIALPLLGWAVLTRRSRASVAALLAFALGVLVPFAWLHASSDGWSTFYTFELPRLLRSQRGWNLGYFWSDLLAVIPASLALVAAGVTLRIRRGRAGGWSDAVLAITVVFAGWATRLDPLSYENALLPTYAVLVWLAAEGLHELRSQGRWFALLLLACAVQMGASLFDPRMHLPSDADRAAGEDLLRRIRAIEGPVLVPYHGHLARQAGKEPSAHMAAMSDIMRCKDEALVAGYRQHLTEQIQARRYAAIVTDGRFMLNTIRSHYRDGGPIFIDDEVFVPVEGQPMQPKRIFLR